ncbi:MAG TPA: manganese efflux pump MntP family protein [Candidatus Hydrogenedens sp.]|nr:manganese efflux pump MntP family protein [Candidatus Hydrogenedens sp.]
MLDPYVLAGISIALAMDAFAVAISVSAFLKNIYPRQTFRLSFHFGLFQAMMPILGWYTGNLIGQWFFAYDHWLAFLILWVIGGKIIYQSLFGKDRELVAQREAFNTQKQNDPTRGLSLVMLSLATSIDAYAVGLSFAFIGVSIWFPSFWIGITAAFLTLVGMHLGSYVGKKFGDRMEIIGAIILFIIGVKILFDHLTA